MPLTMPIPDCFGNFWFGKRSGASAGAAVFPSKRKKAEGVCNTGYWIVFLGPEKGFIFDGPVLKRFKYLQDAVDVLEGLR